MSLSDFEAKVIISILITQYLVFLAFIPFRSQNIEYMLYTLEKFIIFDFQTSNILPFVQVTIFVSAKGGSWK